MYVQKTIVTLYIIVLCFLPFYLLLTKATQRLQKEDSCPLVPMKYGDSPTESKPPAQFTEPQQSSITGITMQYSRN